MYFIIYYYGFLLVGIFSFLLAVFVYLKAHREAKSETFILINVTTGLWALTLFIFHSYFNQPVIFWLRLSQLIAIFIPVTFIQFVFVLLGPLSKYKRQLLFFYSAALVLGSFNFTKLSIASIKYNPILGYYHVLPGPIYRVFTMVFVGMIIYGYFLMSKALKQSSGFQRNEIHYYLAGSILGFIGGATTFLPLYNISIPPLGIFLILVEGIIFAYAILKHRIMDIRTIVSKGLIYSIVTILVFVLFLFVGVKISTYYQFAAAFDFKLLLYILGFCFFLVLVVIPLPGKLERLIEKLIFKRTSASYSELKKGGQKLLTILDSKTLSKFFLQTVVQATGASWGTLWLRDEKKNSYQLITKIGNRKDKLLLGEDFLLNENVVFVKLMERERRLLIREEIFPLLRNINNSIEDKLKLSDFSLVIPLFFENSIKECLFLGEKKSGDLFSPYELQTLTLFSDQAAIAFTNAQLFQQIRKMKEYNESIVNNLDSGLIVINGKGEITTFNRKVQEMVALSWNKALGRTPEILPSPLNEIILRCWRTKESTSIPELTLKIKQNKTLTVSLNTSLINEEQEDTGIIVVLIDLTEVKKLEEKIRHTEKMASIGSMVSQLAHEIKNPLSSIKVFTELLPERFQDEEFRKSFFSLVSQEITKIDDLITQIFNLGKVDVTRRETVSIQKIIEDALSSLNAQLEKQNIKIKADHYETFSLQVDPQSLNKVFTNIFLNSIQAMPQGGNISISTCREKDKNKRKTFLKIDITDEGGGIPENYLHRIFDPFFTTKPQGTGLGLYSCYQTIQNHQGEIRVKNTNLGANFIILLPIAENTTSFIDQKRKIYG